MNAQIEGRVAVVTGGSSGIGFETLRLLLGEGAKVAFCGRNPDRLASAHAALQNEYPEGEVFSWRCDVLNEAEVEAFAAAVAARFGGADMLINNAGQGYVAHFADTPREAWLHEAELKLFGVINPVKAFQPQLEQSDIASITCVNSLLALQPEDGAPRKTAGTGTGVAIPRFAAGLLYHRRGAGRFRRFLPPSVRKDDEKGHVNRLWRDGAGGD